ncbi:MAG: hypothetical protein M1820_006087 [Bogoriella megaspora]|nr:MAG: hypothetical protein M1820_006087 [Bogoriella megaspora]
MGDYGPPDLGLTSQQCPQVSLYTNTSFTNTSNLEQKVQCLPQHLSQTPRKSHFEAHTHESSGNLATTSHPIVMGNPQYPPVYPTGIPDSHSYHSPLDRTSSMSPGNPTRSYNYPLNIQTANLPDGSGSDYSPAQQLAMSSAAPRSAIPGRGSIDESDAHSPASSREHLGAGVMELNMEQDQIDGEGMDGIPGSQRTEDGATIRKDEKGNDPPAWSELKTKAGKERKRLPLACIACRRKKIRCSGEKPACKHCLRSRIPCVYKVTTRKAAPRTDYMAMLDKRLKRMEDRVIKVIPKEEGSRVSNRAVVKPAILGPPTSSSSGKKRPADEAFGPDLDEWAAKPEATERSTDGPAQTKGQDADEHQLLSEGTEYLPPKELQQHLAEVFFDHLYGQSYHLLHKPSYMRKLANGSLPPVLILAVCAIAARFSTHPSVRSEPAFLRGETWASVAREISLKRYDTPNITILIVYLILGLHEFGTCQGGRSWMFGGMAQRMAYALNLHQDLDYDPYSKDKEKLSDLDREIRRRTMWACFMMDRFNSSGTERPMLISEQSLRLQLPIREKYFQMEITGPTEDLHGKVTGSVSDETGQFSNARENMGVAAYQVRLVALWGRLVSYLNLGGKEHDNHPLWSPKSKLGGIREEARQFKESLPERLKYTEDNLQNHASDKMANQFIFMHLIYNQIILFMNRFALPLMASGRLPKDMPREFVVECSDAAVDAANQISSLINVSMEYRVVAAFSGYCAFFASTVHVKGVFSKNREVQQTAKQNLAHNVKFLSKMKKHWGMFHFLAEHLKDLYRQHADAAIKRGGAAQTTAPGESSDEGGGGPDSKDIFQYGDWFSKYPHGVSRVDYEDPATEVKKEPGTDAVLGQKSDLQSVEQFFATLSPETRAAHQRKSSKKQAKASQKQQPPRSQPQRTNSGSQTAQDSESMQQLPQRSEPQQATQAQQAPYLSIPPNPAASTNYAQTSPIYENLVHHGLPHQQHQQHGQFPHAGYSPDTLSILQQQQAAQAQQHQQPFTPIETRASLLAQYSSNVPPTGLDPSTPSTTTTSTNYNWDVDLSSGVSSLGNMMGMGIDTGWYLPFNVEPPDIGEGDFSGAGGGFGIGMGMEGLDGLTGNIGDAGSGMAGVGEVDMRGLQGDGGHGQGTGNGEGME